MQDVFAPRRRRALLLATTALLAPALLAPASGTARAQTVDVTGDVVPGGAAHPWAVGGALSVGDTGAGTLAVEDGGTVNNTTGYIGRQGGSTGTATVTGAPSTWTNAADLHVGYNGTGTLNVENGGRVNNWHGNIGGATGTGIVTVTGGGSTWTNTGSLNVGSNSTGTLTVANGGTASSAFGTIGNAESATGTVTVTGGGSTLTTSDSFTVGNSGDGTLTIADGGAVNSESSRIAIGSTSVSAVTITGGGSTWTNTFDLTVAGEGVATLTIEDGAAATNREGSIGDSEDSTGTVAVTGIGSTWTNTDRLMVGRGGTGTMTVAAGGAVSNTDGYVGYFDVSTGTATVTGENSTWTNTGDLAVGYEGPGTLTVANGGTVSVGGGTGIIHVGQILGSAGTLNIGAAAGGAATAAGTLSGAEVRFGAGTGSLVFNHTGTAHAFALDITGTGAIAHEAGTTILTGDNSAFAGTTTVSGGTLVVGMDGTGALGGGMTIASGGVLGGTGTIGSGGSTVTVAAGAVHAPGNSIGIHTVVGDYTNHGTLRIEATPAAADQVVVGGNVDITGATLELDLSPATVASWAAGAGPYVILDKTSAGAITGTFATVTRNLLFLDANLDYAGGDGNDITLALTRNPTSFASVAQGRNQIATGWAIETLPPANPVWSTVAQSGGVAQTRHALAQLSGGVHASAKSVLHEGSGVTRDAAGGRVRAAFGAAAASEAPVFTFGVSQTPGAVAPTHAGPVLWTEGFGTWSRWDATVDTDRLDSDTGGVLTGVDSLYGDWRIGVMTGYSRSTFSVDTQNASGRSDNYHLGAYGGTTWGDVALRTGLGYTRHAVETTRNVVLPGLTETLSGAYDATTLQMFGEAGYGLTAGSVQLEPFVNLAHSILRTDGFAEQGGAAGLTVDAQTTTATTGTLGLRGEADFTAGSAPARATGLVGWRHAFGSDAHTSTLAFAGSQKFTVAGPPVTRDSAVVEAGVEVDPSADITVGLSYSGQVGSGLTDHGVSARFGMSF